MQQIATDTLIKVYRRTSSAHGKGPPAHCGHIKKKLHIRWNNLFKTFNEERVQQDTGYIYIGMH